MICPSCNYDTTKRVCENCGVDISLFLGVNHLSDVMYNQGLQLANRRELTSAIQKLSYALELNKNNIDARNLLALIYFEMGVVSEAIKHWVISSSLLREGNLAKNYLDSIQKNSAQLDKYIESIKEYNQALIYAKQKSEDMAIIQLKRALDHNPRFVDALNLQALCYLERGEKEKAFAQVEDALAIDVQNPTALYYNALMKRSPKPAKSEPKLKEKTRPISYKPAGNGFGFTDLISFALGIIITYFFVTLMIVPAKIETKNEQIKKLNSDYETLNTTYQKEISDYSQQLTLIEEREAGLKAENEQLNEKLQTQEKVQRIYSLNNLYLLGKVDEAADILYGMDVTVLPEEVTALAETLKSEALSKSSSENFTKGQKLFTAKNYAEAQQPLEKSLQYADKTLDYVDDIYYFLGIIAENMGEKEKAVGYYQSVVDNYPKSNYLNQTKNRLKALGY